ncbi:hypothetical protein QJS10_CPA01g00169 [Acorus calamus]|uniref:Oxidative stress 3 n=1 Tax=Acorus calamus TaxID=4465 RepID=A0AAV9FK47_ACOCL|nr:hypothetical protein QJS10_CPA01g00169 [Acorus calamus]
MDVSLHLQSNHGTMVDDDDEEIGSPSSDGFSGDSTVSSSTDFTDDATSPPSDSPQTPHDVGPLFEMSSLVQQLPLKRGLSKHYQGKSKSFTSFLSVSCMEELVKPENPYKKRQIMMKSCKSYGGGLDTHRSHSPKVSISKRASSSKGSLSAFNLKRTSSSSWASRPPPIPHRSESQTALFA